MEFEKERAIFANKFRERKDVITTLNGEGSCDEEIDAVREIITKFPPGDPPGICKGKINMEEATWSNTWCCTQLGTDCCRRPS